MRSKTTYAEQLLDPRWQKKRLEVLDYADFACEICGDDESTLHVHHKHYIRGRKVWEYDNEQLVCLCRQCHTNQHDNEEKFHDLIARIELDGPHSRDEVYFLISGFIGFKPEIEYDYEKALCDLGAFCRDWWVKK